MPFVTEFGGLEIAHDVIYDKKDPQTRQTISKGNGLKPLKAGQGMHCDYDANSNLFKEIVRRGIPNTRNKTWFPEGTPVWRIPTNRYNEEELRRLWDFFLLNESQPNRVIHYEPDIEDVEIRNYGKTKGFHFPMWLIDELLKRGEFEKALKVGKVNLPSEKKLQKDEYDVLLQAIEERRAFEASGKAEEIELKETQKEDKDLMAQFREQKAIKAKVTKKKDEVLTK